MRASRSRSSRINCLESRKPGNAAPLGENYRRSHYRSEKGATADFVDAGYYLGSANAGRLFVAVSAHQRLQHAHLAC